MYVRSREVVKVFLVSWSIFEAGFDSSEVRICDIFDVKNCLKFMDELETIYPFK